MECGAGAWTRIPCHMVEVKFSRRCISDSIEHAFSQTFRRLRHSGICLSILGTGLESDSVQMQRFFLFY